MQSRFLSLSDCFISKIFQLEASKTKLNAELIGLLLFTKDNKSHIVCPGEEMYLTPSFMSDEKKYNTQKPLILAVEDHGDNLVLISYALDSFGCRFICQTDSANTLVVAKEYQPDLIILDILLPSLSGIEVVRYLKQEPITCEIPVVAVTALASKEDQERILKAGFDAYLSKPYMIEELETIIRRLLCGKLNSQSVFELCRE